MIRLHSLLPLLLCCRRFNSDKSLRTFKLQYVSIWMGSASGLSWNDFLDLLKYAMVDVKTEVSSTFLFPQNQKKETQKISLSAFRIFLFEINKTNLWYFSHYISFRFVVLLLLFCFGFQWSAFPCLYVFKVNYNGFYAVLMVIKFWFKLTFRVVDRLFGWSIG